MKQSIPLDTARMQAEHIVEILRPHCDKIMIAGSIRRECRYVGDIEIVCLPKRMEVPSDDLFVKEPVMAVNSKFVAEVYRWKKIKGDPAGRYTQRLLPGGIKLDLFIPQPHDWGRMVAIRTGSSFFSRIKLAAEWARKGWRGTSDGLRMKGQCKKHNGKWGVDSELSVDEIILPPEFDTERKFWDFIGLEWVMPQDRNWVEKN